MNFCENFKKEMKYRQISQQVLAEKLNTSQATISRWAKGVNQPDFETLEEICRILETTPNELLGWEE